MRILLTGGTGFIGRHVMRACQENGLDVLAHIHKTEMQGYAGVEKIKCQLDLIPDSILKDVDAIANLAVHSANVPYDSFDANVRVNANQVIALAERLWQMDTSKAFYQAGSSFEYGKKTASMYERIPADADLFPLGSYPTSKAMASMGLIALAKTYEGSLSISRFFQVYGEGEAASRLYPTLIEAAKSGKDLDVSPSEQERDFIEVSKAARDFLRSVIEKKAQGGHIHVKNIGSGVSTKLADFIKFHWEAFDGKGSVNFGAKPYRQGEIMKLVANIDDHFMSLKD